MHRILFQLGPVTVFSYGFMLVVAFLIAMCLAIRDARRLPPQRLAVAPTQIIDLSCAAMLGGIVGARLWFVAQFWDVYQRQPHEIPAIWHGGLVWYGGFLGGLLAVAGYLRLHHVPFLRAVDQYIPFVTLAHSIGRIGCFLNGCCYGKPTTAWFGVLFPGHDDRVIPTQLLESGLLFVLFFGLRRLARTAFMDRPGRLFGVYLIGYAVIRMCTEFLRGDQTILWAGLTLPQLFSLLVFLVGVILVRRPATR